MRFTAPQIWGDLLFLEVHMDTPAVFKDRWLPWIFLLPSLIILFVFLFYAAALTFQLSAFDSNLILQTKTFVGFDNFKELLTDPSYHQVVIQTLLFATLVILLGLLFGVTLSSLANSLGQSGRIYRLLLIYPYALSPAVAATLWLFLFNPEVGVVNGLLNQLFGIRPRWLDDPVLAFGLVTFVAVWKNLGFNIAFYLSALQNLPGDVLEAAKIDGASSWQLFWKITFPLLSPITFFLIFTNLIYALFDSFGLVDILTKGGPLYGQSGVTTFLIYRLYQDGFESFKTGFAAAQSVLMVILVGAITFLQFRFGNRRVHYGG